LLVHKALIGHAPQYIADMITPDADLPVRSSLQASHRSDSSSHEQTARSATERSLLPHHVRGISCQQTWNSSSRQQPSGDDIWKSFYFSELFLWRHRFDCVMHSQST